MRAHLRPLFLRERDTLLPREPRSILLVKFAHADGDAASKRSDGESTIGGELRDDIVIARAPFASRSAIFASVDATCDRKTLHCSYHSEMPFFPGTHAPSFS